MVGDSCSLSSLYLLVVQQGIFESLNHVWLHEVIILLLIISKFILQNFFVMNHTNFCLQAHSVIYFMHLCLSTDISHEFSISLFVLFLFISHQLNFFAVSCKKTPRYHVPPHSLQINFQRGLNCFSEYYLLALLRCYFWEIIFYIVIHVFQSLPKKI